MNMSGRCGPFRYAEALPGSYRSFPPVGPIRDSVAALGELRQREDTSVGIEMFVDAAVDLLEACRALEAGILDVQTEVDTLEAELMDDEHGREP